MKLDTIVCGDCLDVMAEMPDGCVDLVIADPPYGISYRSGRQTGMDGKNRKNAASFGKDEFDPVWLTEAYRIAKDDSCLYFFTRWDVIGKWKEAAGAAGWHVVQRLIWDKAHWKMGDLRYYGSQIEDILFCRKGTPTMRWLKRCGNYWRMSSFYLSEGQYNHPTQKPETLIKQFIRDASNESEFVFDPFMGSGTTAVAALKLGRHFYGCDISPEYVQLANERVEKAKLEMAQMELL